MIRIADYKTLAEWKTLGFVLKAKETRPFAWTSPRKIPMYESKQVEKK